jgi:dihydroorotate dehydrogenase
VINRIGLANEGSAAVSERLRSYAGLSSRSATSVPVGVNIAKTHSPEILGEAAIEDFIVSYRALAPLADFVVLNVSCPNTAEGKTFEDSASLSQLLQAVARERLAQSSASTSSPPVLVKLSPPIDPASPAGTEQLRVLVEASKASGIVDGFVVSNTAGDRDVKLSPESREAAAAIGKGGLSGRPLFNRSTATIRKVYELSGGSMPIVGVGGVDSAESTYAKIRAGASLVEVYTAIVYKGPGIFYDIHTGLRRLLEKDGFASITEAVGADFRV